MNLIFTFDSVWLVYISSTFGCIFQTTEQQLKRELDWCIEQLELGMATLKATQKQSGCSLDSIIQLISEVYDKQYIQM